MKFLIIHNPYSKVGGEDSVVRAQHSILLAAGHSVIVYERPYSVIREWRFGRVSAMFSALYNRRSVREIASIVDREKPDIALIHNLLPVISPAILPILRRSGVRTLMTVHNFRLMCPIGLFFRAGHICEQCPQSSLGEWKCLIHRCEGSAAGSFAFALRSYWARKKGYYAQNIDRFMALSEFQRDKLIAYGVATLDKIGVLANPIDIADNQNKTPAERTNFVGVVGRFTLEKGAALLIQVARMMPNVEFRVVGDIIYSTEDIPKNIKFIGIVNRNELFQLYREARVILNTSICYETFGLAIAEGMMCGAVGVVPALAAMSKLVDGGRAGMIYKANDAADLKICLEKILTNSELANDIATKGTQYILEKYSNKNYLDGLYRQIELIAQIQ